MAKELPMYALNTGSASTRQTIAPDDVPVCLTATATDICDANPTVRVGVAANRCGLRPHAIMLTCLRKDDPIAF